jgi:hypothetical protein
MHGVILNAEFAADAFYPGVGDADIGLNGREGVVGRGDSQLCSGIKEGRLAHICLPDKADHHDRLNENRAQPALMSFKLLWGTRINIQKS